MARLSMIPAPIKTGAALLGPVNTIGEPQQLAQNI